MTQKGRSAKFEVVSEQMFKRQPCYFNNTPSWPCGTQSAVFLSNTKADSIFSSVVTAEPPVTFFMSSIRKAPDFLYYCTVVFQQI